MNKIEIFTELLKSGFKDKTNYCSFFPVKTGMRILLENEETETVKKEWLRLFIDMVEKEANNYDQTTVLWEDEMWDDIADLVLEYKPNWWDVKDIPWGLALWVTHKSNWLIHEPNPDKVKYWAICAKKTNSPIL